MENKIPGKGLKNQRKSRVGAFLAIPYFEEKIKGRGWEIKENQGLGLPLLGVVVSGVAP